MTGISGWSGVMFGGLIGAPVLNRVAYFVGKRNALIVTPVSHIAYASSWYLITPYPVVAANRFGTNGLTASGLWMLYGAICADVIDYDELHTANAARALYFLRNVYLKLGSSMGGFLAGPLLARLVIMLLSKQGILTLFSGFASCLPLSLLLVWLW